MSACMPPVWGSLRRCCGACGPATWPPDCVLFAWNPLVILEGMASVHNDLALMALVLAAVLLLARGSAHWGMAALLTSVLVKFVSLPLVPAYLIVGWRGAVNRGRFVAGAGVLLMAAGGGALPPVLRGGRHPGDPGRAALPAGRSVHHQHPGADQLSLEKDWEQEAVQSLVRRVAMGGWVAYAVWETWRLWRRQAGGAARRPRRPALPPSSYRILLYFLLFACLWFQPWYLIWLLALAPLLGPGADAGILIAFSALVQVKYFIFDFVWFWEFPMVDILVPEAATTVLIFVSDVGAPGMEVLGVAAGCTAAESTWVARRSGEQVQDRARGL